MSDAARDDNGGAAFHTHADRRIVFPPTGMPARIKSNLCIGKGVANGASGKIYHIDWRPGTAFVRQSDGL